jgi:hypothetical protein
MKRLLVIAALLALTFTAFGQVQLSAGAGASFAPVWSSDSIEVGAVSMKTSASLNMITAKAFVDATYVEIGVGFTTNLKKQKAKGTFVGVPMTDYDINDDGPVGSWLAVQALGKYPFKVGSFDVFPLVGIEYDLNLGYKDPDGNDLKTGMDADEKANLNMLWIKAGVGADFSVSKSIFIRPEALFGYKLLSKLESDSVKDVKDAGGTEKTSTFSVNVGVSVGYKL